MKKLLLLILIISGFTITAAAQTTERCFHLDHINFLNLDPAFWQRHSIASVANRPDESLKTKYYNVTELNGGIGLSVVNVPYSNRFYGITTVNGLLLKNRLGLGIGIGADSYNGGWLIPVYGDARYYFDLGLISLFAIGEGGVKISPDDFGNKTRVFVSPGIGAALPLTTNSKIVFSAGLLSQWQFDDKRRDSFINLRLGVLFKAK